MIPSFLSLSLFFVSVSVHLCSLMQVWDCCKERTTRVSFYGQVYPMCLITLLWANTCIIRAMRARLYVWVCAPLCVRVCPRLFVFSPSLSLSIPPSPSSSPHFSFWTVVDCLLCLFWPTFLLFGFRISHLYLSLVLLLLYVMTLFLFSLLSSFLFCFGLYAHLTCFSLLRNSKGAIPCLFFPFPPVSPSLSPFLALFYPFGVVKAPLLFAFLFYLVSCWLVFSFFCFSFSLHFLILFTLQPLRSSLSLSQYAWRASSP